MPTNNPKSFGWSIAPYWRIDRPSPPKQLSESKRCHTAIIGGGITGLAAALALAQSGKHVIVLDATQTGEGSTGWCAGILSSDTTVELSILEAAFGYDKAKFIADQLSDLLKSHQSLLGQDCDWQSGNSLCLAAKSRHRTSLLEEVQTLSKFKSKSAFFDKSYMPDFFTGFPCAFQMYDEHAVHPVKMLLSFVKHIQLAGGEVFENSRVETWSYNNGQFVLNVGAHQVIADNLVECRGMKSSDCKELEKFRRLLIPANGHILVTKPTNRSDLPQHCINFWDSLQLYHYGRYLPDSRILIGGMDAPGFVPGRSLPSDNGQIRKLYKWAQEHHAFELPAIEHAWRASLIVPFDGLPVLSSKQLASNNTLITAVTDGIPSALMLGQAILQLVERQSSELHSLFSHKRRLSLAGQVLSTIPPQSLAGKFVHGTAFAALSLWDALP